jgi:1,4-alpha-glucan branching enzyme
MRLSSVALVAAIVVTTVCSSCAGATRPSSPEMTRAGVRFELIRADAKSVALAGTFNQWSASATPLSREGTKGGWTVVVPLPPGEHLFMYVIDGTQWITPPMADDFMDDGFGARNGVVIVRPAER